MFKVGDKVTNKIFGDGVVTAVYSDNAQVDFHRFGTKKILFSALTPIKQITVNLSDVPKDINNYSIIVHIIAQMEKNNVFKMSISECFLTCADRFKSKATHVFITQSLEPSYGYVYKKHLINLLQKIQNKTLKIVFQNENFSPKTTPVQHFKKEILSIDDFESACISEDFYSTVKLFYARCIVELLNSAPKKEFTVKISKISEMLFNHYLYQISVGHFYNSVNKNNPDFVETIYSDVQNGIYDLSLKANYVKLISDYLTKNVLNQFLVVKGKQSPNIYCVLDNSIVFSEVFLKLYKANKKKALSFDGRLINRIAYFMNINNKNTELVLAYTKSLNKEPEKKPYVLKFEYNEELMIMEDDLKEDLYLKNDFKELMKKYGIPSTEVYLKACLDRINYSLKTKRIILKSSYPTLKSYYRELVSKTEVYYYSNPLNLDEYDVILKSLMNDLYLIEVDRGVYLTRKNMERNGIDSNAIFYFSSYVESRVRKESYCSLAKIIDGMTDNPIVDYCNGNLKQLLQFIKPIEKVKIISFDNHGVVLAYSDSKQYRGDFVRYIFGNRSSMTAYEIQDFVQERFGVEYSIADIEKDVKQTTLFYSEEMEKLYKYKSLYIQEVYYDKH